MIDSVLVYSLSPMIGCFMGPIALVLYALLKIRASAVPFGKCCKSPARDWPRQGLLPKLRGERKLKSLLYKLQHMPTLSGGSEVI